MQLALANDALMRAAECIAALRTHRGLTQEALADAMKTSQAAVARIEGAQKNITLRTLEKAVAALKGRLQLSIAPLELNLPLMPDWWELAAAAATAAQPFTCKFVGVKQEDPVRVGIGWESSAPAMIEAGAKVAQVVSAGSATVSNAKAGSTQAAELEVA